MPCSIARRRLLAWIGLLWIAYALSASGTAAAQTRRFDIVLDPRATPQPAAGRLFVFTSTRTTGEPRLGLDWFAPAPFFAADFEALTVGQRYTVDDTWDSFPEAVSSLPAGNYRVQAVWHQAFDSHSPGRGVGNLYSEVATIRATARGWPRLELRLTETVRERPFPQNRWVQEVVLLSPSLSAFHRRPVEHRAAVVLPASYEEEPYQRYPVIYSIHGFGGDHRRALQYTGGPPQAADGEVEFLRVFLNADCNWGHHVFADSATNGPRGTALVEELLPHIDAEYRTFGQPTARFVTGHSSGGWSSLWLQVAYPDVFGGVWSTSPDPVDFRDFQRVDLYADPPLSLYFDPSGERRPIARRGTTPVLWFPSFGQMDDVLKRGGQLRSFEAVFSPLDAERLPRRLWDRDSGRIDPEVARAWEAYDIRLILQRNWAQLEPRLQGKLHVVTGGLDTFYLEGAVELLAETLRELGSDAQVSVVAGRDHSNILTDELRAQMRREMSDAFRRHHPLDDADSLDDTVGSAAQ